MDILKDKTIDCIGLSCPMPIVKTKKAMETMSISEVIEILATDKGSVADLQAWTKSTHNEYLGYEMEGNIYKHYIRKISDLTKNK
ncbi:MAG: sulfurtransferase TusA family protein [Cellulosilyticaceae bacterium]